MPRNRSNLSIEPVYVLGEQLQFTKPPDILVRNHRRLQRETNFVLIWSKCRWIIPIAFVVAILIAVVVLLIHQSRTHNYAPMQHTLPRMRPTIVLRPSTTAKTSTATLPSPPTVHQYMPFEFMPQGEHATLPSINGSWFNSTQRLFVSAADRQVQLFDVLTGRRTVLLSLPEHPKVDSVELSADGEYLLVGYQIEIGASNNPYRLGTTYNIISMWYPDKTLDERTTNLGVKYLAMFGPRGSQLVYVDMKRNMYYIPSAKSENWIVVTTEGRRHYSFGVCDYAYGKDVFKDRTALWFSPDGLWLAFAAFNDDFVVAKWEHRSEAYNWPANFMMDLDHSADKVLMVPKPGLPNPKVELYVARVADSYVSMSHKMPMPATLPNVEGNESILAAVHWTSDMRLVSVWLNRAQTKAFVQTCSVQMKCQLTVSFASKGGWLRFQQLGLFSRVVGASVNSLAIIHAVQHGQRSIDQVVLYQLSSVQLDRPSTPVAVQPDTNHAERIVHWDRQENVLFYLGNTQRRPEERHLFALRVDWRTDNRSDCLTCSLSALDGWAYTHFDAVFNGSPGSRLLLLVAQGPSLPRQDVFEWGGGIHSVVDSQPVSMRHVRTLQSHAARRERWRNVTMSVLRYERVRLRNGGMARVKLLLPETYEVTCNAMAIAAAAARNAGVNRTFSLLVRAYNGPDSFAGTAEWTDSYEEYLAVNRSVVVAIVDARGSSRSSLQNKYAVYKKLGWTEAEDLIDVTQTLKRQLQCVDTKSVGLAGMNYGGYVVSMTLYADRISRLFRCALVGAPIERLMSSLSFYAERYMGTSIDIYKNSSIDYNLADLTHRSVYLVHGRLNTDFERTTDLLEMFTRAGVPRARHYFPSAGRAINSREYYQNLNTFYGNCFKWDSR